MNDPYNRRGRLYRLPDGQKVRIESREGDLVTVRRIGGPRRQTLAVCRFDQLKPV
jgi:hypothetical protein